MMAGPIDQTVGHSSGGEMVKVSPGAPYHHFPDRRSLLLAVALKGYQRLTSEGRLAVEGSAERAVPPA